MIGSLERKVEVIWYGASPLRWILLPFSWLFAALVATRRALYAAGILKCHRPGAAVVIVGNLTVGGTGKTPVTIWLTNELARRGFRPAIVSRGYRGNVGAKPVQATADSSPGDVGDEAILLAAYTGRHVFVHPDRAAAADAAVAAGADIVVADDGLQHYRLARDFEIAVIDGGRGIGNGHLLPAGPLREPPSRLDSVGAVLVHRRTDGDCGFQRRAGDRRSFDFRLQAGPACRLDGSEERHIREFAGRTVHAVAGIGHPESFFRMLEAAGIDVRRHPLPDHADIGPDDIAFGDELAVLMTSKDAVKCRWLDTRDCWEVPVDVVFDHDGGEALLELVVAAVATSARRSAP